MLAHKRKYVAEILGPFARRVRPRMEEEEEAEDSYPVRKSAKPAAIVRDEDDDKDEDDDEDEDEVDDIGKDADSVDDYNGGYKTAVSKDNGADKKRKQSAADACSESEDDDSESELPAPDEQSLDISTISFGALARAQASLTASSREERSSRPDLSSIKPSSSKPRSERAVVSRAVQKIAPTEMTSKRPVPRRPASLAGPHGPTKAARSRDPRFDPTTAPAQLSAAQETRARAAYAFLDEYRSAELAELRKAARKAPSAEARRQASLDLAAAEAQESERKRARQRREIEQRVTEEHRAHERELEATSGKQRFFLKRSEVRRRVLVEKYAGMTDKEVDRVIERKRKKSASKGRMELDRLVRKRGP